MADQYLVKWHTGSETGAEEVEIARTAVEKKTRGGMEATSQDRKRRGRVSGKEKKAHGEGRTRSLQISDRKSLTL